MTSTIELPSLRGKEDTRWTVGVWVSSQATRISAVLAAIVGFGLRSQAHIAAANAIAVPDSVVDLFQHVSQGAGSCPAQAVQLAMQLAQLEAPLIGRLCAQAKVAPERVLAVGVHDPGLWHFSDSGTTCYLGLTDGAALAEATGSNIIDSFPARDLAQGGQGGPISALAEWILLRSPATNRALVHLGQSVRMTLLPAAGTVGAIPRLLSFDVGPGTGLLDLLAEQLTDGAQHFDPGGHLGVQGHQVPELLDHWLKDPYFERSLPRWHPYGVRPERFLGDAMRLAVTAGWSVQDVLCTATHFVAETIARAVRHRLRRDAMPEEVILTGGGQLNGLLLREVCARLPDIHVLRASELGIAQGVLAPACVAVLASLAIDQVPMNQTSVTGARLPRVIGRWTPGSSASWQRLIRAMSEAKPAGLGLRRTA